MPRAVPLAPARPSTSTAVSTMLTPDERLRVDAAGEGLYRTLHRDTLDDVLRDLRERRAAVVLVSVARCAGPGLAVGPATGGDPQRMAAMVREFPRVPAVALLSPPVPGVAQSPAAQAALAHTVLSLGHSGVQRLVDVRAPGGWRELRSALARDGAESFERLALDRLGRDLAGAPADCHRFFHLLFRAGPAVTTVRALARHLGVVPSTLMSRFYRARIPAPKRYLALSRLVRAARLFENPGLSVASVANALEYSSPQSFGRHVRTTVGLTAVRFRERYDGEGMLHRFRDDLVLPYAPALRTFTPLEVRPGWMRGVDCARRSGVAEGGDG